MSAVHLVAVALLLAINAVMLPLLFAALRDSHRRGVQRVRADRGGPLRAAWTIPQQRTGDGRSWE